MKKKLLVAYIDVRGLRSEDIEYFIERVSERITPETLDGEIIVIPVNNETRITCIDPVYITKEELIKEHETHMLELNQHLKYNVDQIKNEKDV